MADMVRCAGCGFLALRSNTTRQLVEAEDCYRETGYIPEIVIDGRKSVWAYEDLPICYVGATNFKDDIQRPADQENRKSVVRLQRTCKQFAPWKRDCTPKEHLAMIQLAEEKVWREEREADDKADRDRRDQETRKFQSDQAEQSRRHQNRTLTVQIVAASVALLGLIVNSTIGLFKPPPTIVVQPTPVVVPQIKQEPPAALPAPVPPTTKDAGSAPPVNQPK